MLSVTARLAEGTLFVTGDEQDNVITISRTAGGTILVNDGAIPIQGESPTTIANTTHLHVVAAGGNDNVSLNEANGPLPGAALFGGPGNDTLTGGSGPDFADAESGNDTVRLGGGDDDFQWNPGDGSDLVDGQGGSDTIVFNGADGNEKFDISDAGTGLPFHRVRLTRDLGNVAMDLAGLETIDLNANGGADAVTVDDLTVTDVFGVKVDLGGAGFGDGAADALIINGTAADDVAQVASFGTTIGARVSLFPFVSITNSEGGSDTLTLNTLGGNDVLDASDLFATNASQLIKLTMIGGAGNDSLTGSQGVDTFLWNPGDGSDAIDGGENPDTLVFNGSDLPERFDLSAGGGGRARLTRDIGGITMDLGGVEDITVNALGGADAVTVNDLTGTAVTRIDANLAPVVGVTTGDGQTDSVVVNGRDAADLIPVIGLNGTILVNGAFASGSGLPYFMVIRAVEPNDALRINGNGGDDRIDAGTLQIPVTFTADGGAGNDSITGGDGDDIFLWNFGGGNDVLEGRGGTDTLNFNGSGLNENIAVSANASRVRLTDDVATVAVDFDAIEQLAVNALGGSDNVVVNDLTGTALAHLKIRNIVDGQPDNVTVNGSSNADAIAIDGDALNGITIAGLAAQVEVVGATGVPDLLTVNALAGADTIDASELQPGGVLFALNGGDGNDTLTGGQGDGSINGGPQTDTINVIGNTTVLPGDGGDSVNVNTRGAGPAAHAVFESTQRIGALTIGGGGVATLTPGGGKVLTVTSLAITGSGKLDLNDNALIVDYSPPAASPIAAIQSLLRTGFNGGAWNGSGIMSSLGEPSRFALGFAEAADAAVNGEFAGQAVDATAVLVKFTLYGDATLDGSVDFNDLASLAQNYNTPVSAAARGSWSRGDFTYDGLVDFNDLAKLAQNYNVSVPPAPSAPAASSSRTPPAPSQPALRRPARAPRR